MNIENNSNRINNLIEKFKKRKILYIFLIIFALGIVGSLLEQKSTSSNSIQLSSIENVPKEIGVPDQITFHKNLKYFEQKYDEASNEMQKSKVYRELREFLRSYLKDGRFKNWEGVIKRIGTTEGGSLVYIEIFSDLENKEIEYKTWNNQLSDMFTNSMIKLNSSVYKQLENLNEGDAVIFSGSFITDSQRGFKEASILEENVVKNPEYIIKFYSITKK